MDTWKRIKPFAESKLQEFAQRTIPTITSNFWNQLAPDNRRPSNNTNYAMPKRSGRRPRTKTPGRRRSTSGYRKRHQKTGRAPRLGTRTTAGRTYTLFTKPKRPRFMLRRIRRRYRRFNNFAQRISNKDFRPIPVRYTTVQPAIICAKNQQVIAALTGIALPLAHINGFFQKLGYAQTDDDYKVAPPQNPSLFNYCTMVRGSIQLELINHSLSKTYVQLYWLMNKDDTNDTVFDGINADITTGRAIVPTDPSARFKDYDSVFKSYKIIKKQYLDMEPGAVAHVGLKLKRNQYISQESNNFQNFQRGKTISLVYRVWSQLVKNVDNNDFIMDDAIIGTKTWVHYWITRGTRSQIPLPATSTTTKPIVGAQQVSTENTMQTS